MIVKIVVIKVFKKPMPRYVHQTNKIVTITKLAMTNKLTITKKLNKTEILTIGSSLRC